MSKHKTATKWVGYVDTWFVKEPVAYIFQVDFLETGKQFRFVGGKAMSIKDDTAARRALDFKTHINKGDGCCVYDSWDDAYAAMLASWTRTLKNDQKRVEASQKALNAVLALEQDHD